MWAIAWARTRRVGKTPGVDAKTPGVKEARWEKPKVFLRNFYNEKLPADTTIVFVFLMPKAVPRLLRYLQQQNLPHAKYLVCYTFGLPKLAPTNIVQTESHGATYVYAWSNITNAGVVN
jgi:hypothetical protein